MFEVGDVVRASGPLMTVDHIDDSVERSIVCAWFEKNGYLERDGFRPETLTLVRKRTQS